MVLVVFALACGRQTGGTHDVAEQPLKGHQWEYHGSYVPGEVLVKFKETVDRTEIDRLAAKYNCRVEEYVSTVNLYRMKILNKRDVWEVVEGFGKEPEVEYAEPNFIDQPAGDSIR